MDCTQAEFWESRYRAGHLPWDLQRAPPALLEYLSRAHPAGSVLVPGCGSAYEVAAFRSCGWRVLAIDFSAAAIERARTVLGPLAADVRLADFFADHLGGPFDLVYERTFLCALPPARWPEYARRMASLLRPHGRLAGLFTYGHEPEPPPFPLTEQSAATILGSNFQLEEDRAIPAAESLPLYAGKERWQVWRRKDAR